MFPWVWKGPCDTGSRGNINRSLSENRDGIPDTFPPNDSGKFTLTVSSTEMALRLRFMVKSVCYNCS